MLGSTFTLFSTALLATLSSVNALSVTRDVTTWAPTIISPDRNSIWVGGLKQVIGWDTSDFPLEFAGTGSVFLGSDINGIQNYNSSDPLATGFDLWDGGVSVDFPPTREIHSNAIIVLTGEFINTNKSVSAHFMTVPSSFK